MRSVPVLHKVGDTVAWQSAFYSGLPPFGEVVAVDGDPETPCAVFYTVKFEGIEFDVTLRWDEALKVGP